MLFREEEETPIVDWLCKSVYRSEASGFRLQVEIKCVSEENRRLFSEVPIDLVQMKWNQNDSCDVTLA